MSYSPDYADFRDHAEETEEIRDVLKPTGLPSGVSA